MILSKMTFTSPTRNYVYVQQICRRHGCFRCCTKPESQSCDNNRQKVQDKKCVFVDLASTNPEQSVFPAQTLHPL